MEDLNLMACLFPEDGDPEALEAIYRSENRSRYVPPHVPPQGETKSKYRSRESTVSLEDEEDNTPLIRSYLLSTVSIY